MFDSIFEELSIVRLYLRGIVNCSTLFLRNCQLFDSIFEELSIVRLYLRGIVNCSTLFERNCQLFDSIFEELSIVRLYLRGIVNCSTLFWYRYLKLYVFVTLSTEIFSLIVMQQLS